MLYIALIKLFEEVLNFSKSMVYGTHGKVETQAGKHLGFYVTKVRTQGYTGAEGGASLHCAKCMLSNSTVEFPCLLITMYGLLGNYF